MKSERYQDRWKYTLQASRSSLDPAGHRRNWNNPFFKSFFVRKNDKQRNLHNLATSSIPSMWTPSLGVKFQGEPTFEVKKYQILHSEEKIKKNELLAIWGKFLSRFFGHNSAPWKSFDTILGQDGSYTFSQLFQPTRHNLAATWSRRDTRIGGNGTSFPELLNPPGPWKIIKHPLCRMWSLPPKSNYPIYPYYSFSTALLREGAFFSVYRITRAHARGHATGN